MLLNTRKNFSFRNFTDSLRPRWSCPHPTPYRQFISSRTQREIDLPSPSTTNIEKIIHDNIKAAGPISFGTYMSLCLGHPTHGYYTHPENAVFGTRGDFVTSPEISQVFGELLTTWLASRWLTVSATSTRKPIRLVELGPGRGTLMADALRVLSQISATRTAVRSIHLVETSAPLRKQQAAILEPYIKRLGCSLEFHDTVDELEPDSEVFTALLAHEFFDALPFRVIQRTEEGWAEVLIDNLLPPDSSATSTSSPLDVTTAGFGGSPLPDASTGLIPSFRAVLSRTSSADATLLGSISPRFKTVPVGSRIEVSPEVSRTARLVSRLLSPSIGVDQRGSDGEEGMATSDGGAALVVDYGSANAASDSFRAFRAHKQVSPFVLPGSADLTVDVDFSLLAESMSSLARPLGLKTQRDFLIQMGAAQRLEMLLKGRAVEKKQEMMGAVGRLIQEQGMGGQYKVLGVVGKDSRREIGTVYPFEEVESQS